VPIFIGRGASFLHFYARACHDSLRVPLPAISLTQQGLNQMSQTRRPVGITVVGTLAIIFGFGEVVVGFAGNYLGILSKSIAPANSTVVIGAFYILGGVSLFLTRRKWGAALSILFIGAEILGRIYLVVIGIAPSSGPDAVKILIGGAIASAFIIYIGLKWNSFE
jgi:hypothetical protein